jgi:hypothetical protein
MQLLSQEGEVFVVSTSLANFSKLADEIFEKSSENSDLKVVDLSNIKSSVLLKIIEFCNYYNINPFPEIKKVRLP